MNSMKHPSKKHILYFVAISILFAFFPRASNAQSATVFFSPASQTIIEGSTFDVSAHLNTNKNSINTMDLTIIFPPDKLQIVRPSAGASLIQLWVEPPSYSNTNGTARFAGIIPNGIVTQSGLITTITFKALTTGIATIGFATSSKIFANDGLGTEVKSAFGRGVFTITTKPPEGIRVFSDTHPFESQWYNNKNPVFGWEKNDDIADFSFLLDDKPSTIPDNIPDTEDSQTHYEDLKDGLSYFHIKARKGDVWGATTNFLVRIDTIPPASFQPTVEILRSGISTRALINFITTDSLSRIRQYEVAVINKKETPDISPVFIQAESPYQLSNPPSNALRIIVRAIDGAGNIRDASIDVRVPSVILASLGANLLAILLTFLLLLMLFVLFHYLFNHRISTRVKEIAHLMKHGEEIEEIERELHEPNEQSPTDETRQR